MALDHAVFAGVYTKQVPALRGKREDRGSGTDHNVVPVNKRISIQPLGFFNQFFHGICGGTDMMLDHVLGAPAMLGGFLRYQPTQCGVAGMKVKD